MARVNSAEALGAEAGAAVIERLESLSRAVPPGRPTASTGVFTPGNGSSTRTVAC
jgi:hypothetical protein